MLTVTDLRHGLSDPDVKKQRTKLYARGIYFDVRSLEEALRERGCRFDNGELDRLIDDLGGQRLPERGRWLARLLKLKGLPRPSQYYLPEPAYQEVRRR